MSSVTKTLCLWLLLAIQVNAETSGSLEITGSYFPKSLDESFDTNITAEAKVMGYEELSHFQLVYEFIFRKSLNDSGMDICLLYTSPSPRDQRGSRMPSSA